MRWPLNQYHSSTSGGILMPALSYRFRVLFDIEEDEDQDLLLTQQMMSCENNYVKKETKITIREPEDSILHKIILKMCRSKIDIRIQEMNGSNSVILNTICFSGCVLKNHKVKYDYSASEVVKHVLTFKAVDVYQEGTLEIEDVLVLE